MDDSDDPVITDEDVEERSKPFRNKIREIKEPKADEELNLDSIIQEDNSSLLERGA